MAAMALLPVHVERSIFPGVCRVLVSRLPNAPPPVGPPAAAAALLAPDAAALESPELLEAAEPLEGLADGAAGAGEPQADCMASTVARQVGNNVLVGGMYGLFAHLFRPGLRRLSRRAGALGPAVQIGGEAGAFGAAYALAGVCRGLAEHVGGVVGRIPLLGGSHPVGAALQIGLASYLGGKVGEFFVPEHAEAAASSAASAASDAEGSSPVFLANMCVMCNTPFAVGGNHSIAALSCGHACLCNVNEDGDCCADTYLAERKDCPLCRSSPVNVMHELRV